MTRLEKETLSLRMWGYPYLTCVTIVGMATVIIAMAFIPDTRLSFFLSLITLAVVGVAYLARHRYGGTPDERTLEPASAPPEPATPDDLPAGG